MSRKYLLILLYFFSYSIQYIITSDSDCFAEYFNVDSSNDIPPIIHITSFASSYLAHVKANGYEDSILKETNLNHKLIIYHEDDLPSIKGCCLIDMRVRFPWLEWELHNDTSGLNQYFKIATYQEPIALTKVGDLKTGHILMMKVLAIQDAVANSPNGSLVIWMDTDTTILRALDIEPIKWLLTKDVSYIPFWLQDRKRSPFMEYNLNDEKVVQSLLRSKWWRVESGTMIFNVNSKTRALTTAALRMYRGGLFELAKRCFEKDPICWKEEIGNNLYTNDIFVWALCLHADIHGHEKILAANLSHGWLATEGFDWQKPDSQFYYVWGNHQWHCNFPPVSRNDSIITNFFIGSYIFHHFGMHKKGALSVQIKEGEDKNNSWRYVTNPGDKKDSLYALIGDLRKRKKRRLSTSS